MGYAMVTARMSDSKKEAGNLVLKELGLNPSQFINDIYDYLIDFKESPINTKTIKKAKITQAQIKDAKNWLTSLSDSCAYLKDVDTDVSLKEIREQRLRDRYPEYFSDDL